MKFREIEGYYDFSFSFLGSCKNAWWDFEVELNREAGGVSKSR